MTDNCSGRKFRKQGEPQENKNRVETERQETGYVWADTHLPPYLPYPRFLLKMDITQTAKLLYALLLDRTTLSQKNGWQDESGRTYIIFPVTATADALDKSPSTIKEALNELDRAGILHSKPPVCEAAASSPDFRTYGGRKSVPHKSGKPDY